MVTTHEVVIVKNGKDLTITDQPIHEAVRGRVADVIRFDVSVRSVEDVKELMKALDIMQYCFGPPNPLP